MTQARAAALADSVVDGGYASLIFDRLARQASEVMDVEQTTVVVRDPMREDEAIAVAACGFDDDVVGSRFDANEGLTGQVLASGEPVIAEQVGPANGHHSARLTRVVAPVGWDSDVRGALAVRTAQPQRRFGNRELRRLSQLADTVGAALQHAERRTELLAAVAPCMAALTSAIDERDPYTAGHSEAVVELSSTVADCLGLSQPDLLELQSAALLHDLGKIGVPDEILNKPAPLDAYEEAIVRHHTVWGAQLLAGIAGLEPVATIVRFHHERWDGGGYPDGLAGSQIPVSSRVIAVCDAYHAMTSDRPYRKALSNGHAIWELVGHAGSQFDPAMVECFIDTLQRSETPTEGGTRDLSAA
jgi:putative nucleotidyltransferase with HDIG domain